jgi:hypothetical protein
MANTFNAAKVNTASLQELVNHYNKLIDILSQQLKILNATIANGLTVTDGILSISPASSTTSGLLSSAHWNVFNNKQDSLTFGIADTNSLIVNDASAADNDYAKFTATGIEGVPYATVLSDIGAQAAGNELTALQALADTAGFVKKTGDGAYSIDTTTYEPDVTFGIANTNGVKIDAADVADNDYAKFTTTGVEGRSYTEVLSDIGAAVVTNYTSTLESVSWTGASAPYSQALTINGILDTDTPILDMVPSGTYLTDQTMETNWGECYRAVTSTNTLTVYAHSIPTANIPIIVKVVK